MPYLLSRLLAAWICTAVLLTAASGTYALPATPRIALVIGNSNHQKLGPLRTARNDAEDIAKALANLGFQVTPKFDAELSTMQEGLREFSDKLRSEPFHKALAVFYFAGYGLQSGGRNFLLPTNFDANRDRYDLDKAAIALDSQLIQVMGNRAGGSNLIILDACRDDPFGQRAGLAQVDDVPSGTLIDLAAAPNSRAIDTLDPKAPERNGIYTKQLLRKLDKPSPEVDVEQFFNIVGYDVYEASNEKQKPRVMASANVPAMPEKISLALETAVTRASDEELKLWRRIERSADLCDFEQYLERYPQGEFADGARATLNAIKTKNEAARRAFVDLPQALRVQATQSFQEGLVASQARCARNWGKSASERLRLFPVGGGIGAGTSLVIGKALEHTIVAGFDENEPCQCCRSGPCPRRGDLRSTRAQGALLQPVFWGPINNSVVLRVGGRTVGFTRPTDFGVGRARHAVWAARPDAGFRSIRLAEASTPAATTRREVGDEEFRAELLKAEQGDMNAMFRVALIYDEGTHDVNEDTAEMMRWLVLSSSLGNGLASYKLYRYFAQQPAGYLRAVKFRSLANQQGYYGPVALSNKR